MPGHPSSSPDSSEDDGYAGQAPRMTALEPPALSARPTARFRRVGKGALAPCPRLSSLAMVGTLRFATRLLLPPLPRQRRERAAFAIAGVLVVDPVMRIDVIERNAVARPQHFYQHPPRRNLRLGGDLRDVGIIAGEFHPDRSAADHPV